MSKAEKYLPFILAILGPAISVVNNSSLLLINGKEFVPSLNRYLEASVFLLLVWYLNRFLINAEFKLKDKIGLIPTTIIANILLIALVCLVDYYLIGAITAKLGMLILVLRLAMIILIYNVIIRVFNSQRERVKLEMQNLSLQAENLKFQIETLNQQVNPHFLFNSLNTLLDLVEDNKEAAVKFIRSFSNLYRIVLQSAKHDFIPLKDELKFLDDYWRLLKMRFNDAIDLNLTIDKTHLDKQIPPLCLQFLIENAVKHNEVSKAVPLVIDIYNEGDWIVIKNKIKPIKYPVAGEKLGLINLQQRFTLLHRPLQFGEENNHFVVKIPLKQL